MENKENVRMLSQKKDSSGTLISEVYERFFEGRLFSTVWNSYCESRVSSRVVFAEPQRDFNCGFGVKMMVKAFSEQKDTETGRVYKRSYETPDGTTLIRDYITGECTTRRKDGREVTHDTAMLQKMMELAGTVQSF
ncbi:MAG: hypothetical protein II938_04480 [Alphaproteobacteria bacterium]|nr:hypothetical protein [Alphaproteobacteria bacterium]